MEQYKKIRNSANLSSAEAGDRSTLKKIAGKLEGLTGIYNKVLIYISCTILFLLMFLTLFDVIGRSFFNSPIKGTYELTGFALAIMVFFSLGAAQIKGDHIEIDFLTKKFSKKVQYYWNAFIYIILSVVVVLTSWQLGVYAQRMLQGANVSGDLGIPMYTVVFITAIGALGFALSLINSSVQNLLKAVESK